MYAHAFIIYSSPAFEDARSPICNKRVTIEFDQPLIVARHLPRLPSPRPRFSAIFGGAMRADAERLRLGDPAGYKCPLICRIVRVVLFRLQALCSSRGIPLSRIYLLISNDSMFVEIERTY